jgi:guanosine-3',5'-bis(diphosphate) 3'-pyrophosphohydrolase
VLFRSRPKHFYSIYRKMVQRNKPFEEIYDLLAIRIITTTVNDCYHILGIVHSMWRPIAERFKDYISTPKSNGYQSLHTTVFGEKGVTIEIQIRTWEMNQTAEDGIAAHWLYKDGEASTAAAGDDEKSLVWLKNLIEWQKELTDSTEFYEFFKIDLYHAEIFIFTPKGDLISLPKGATVLDFAFAVHTQLGLHCIGARVDGRIEPINKPLRSGSTVEILTAVSKRPSIHWLREVKTAKARTAIRRGLKAASQKESIELGKKIVATNYHKLHFASSFNDHVPGLLTFLGVNSLDRLYELAGSGELGVHRIMQYFRSLSDQKNMRVSMVSRIVRSITHTHAKDPEVLVGGSENMMVRFARCCSPIPGDPIIGFITRGRGISIHRYDCPNVPIFANDKERTITVSWEERETRKYVVFLEIVALDRPGLLHEISAILANFGANVLEGTVKTQYPQARC